MNFRKILCLIFSFVMLFLCSCKTGDTSSGVSSSPSNKTDVSPAKPVSLLYRANDSLNPYSATSKLNRQLATLMFDPLVKTDASYQPQYVLAETISYEGKTCTVTLKNTSFSDGTAVTAADVVYSYNLAKNSELIYSYQLENVVSFTAKDDKTLTVNLKKADPYFANLLDFPIIKSGSDKLNDENMITLPPIGSGRYIIDLGNEVLYANPSYIGGVPSVSRIILINAPDKEVEKYNLETGNVSIYSTDLSDGTIPPMVGTSVPVPLNNLIYIGVNLSNSALSDVKFRHAISYALDRTAVCGDAYYTYATPAAGLYNPVWEDAKGLQNIPSEPDMQNVVANLKQLGYNNKDANGFYVDDGGKGISFTLVAYSGNEWRLTAAKLIKSQLESAGIKIELKSLGWEEYVGALTSGDFDLYIAETRLLSNMDVTELVTSGGSLAYGIARAVAVKNPSDTDTSGGSADESGETEGAEETAGLTLDSAVEGFYSEQLSLIDIINSFNAELPVIPVCYRSGVTVCDASLKADNVSSASDAYFGIQNISLN